MKRSRNFKKQASTATATEAAYAAGLVDGEGCISAKIYGDKLQGSLVVTNTNRECIEWLRSTFSVGKVYQQKRKSWKTSYIWKVNLFSAASVVSQLLPFLKIKRSQAEILMKIAGIETPCRVGENRELQRNLVAGLTTLNRRGELQLHA